MGSHFHGSAGTWACPRLASKLSKLGFFLQISRLRRAKLSKLGTFLRLRHAQKADPSHVHVGCRWGRSSSEVRGRSCGSLLEPSEGSGAPWEPSRVRSRMMSESWQWSVTPSRGAISGGFVDDSLGESPSGGRPCGCGWLLCGGGELERGGIPAWFQST